MARQFELCSNSFSDNRATIPEGMARLSGESSNALFEVLEDWEHQLKAIEEDIPSDIEGPTP